MRRIITPFLLIAIFGFSLNLFVKIKSDRDNRFDALKIVNKMTEMSNVVSFLNISLEGGQSLPSPNTIVEEYESVTSNPYPSDIIYEKTNNKIGYLIYTTIGDDCFIGYDPEKSISSGIGWFAGKNSPDTGQPIGNSCAKLPSKP